jgi:hypothetical protein
LAQTAADRFARRLFLSVRVATEDPRAAIGKGALSALALKVCR